MNGVQEEYQQIRLLLMLSMVFREFTLCEVLKYIPFSLQVPMATDYHLLNLQKFPHLLFQLFHLHNAVLPHFSFDNLKTAGIWSYNGILLAIVIINKKT